MRSDDITTILHTQPTNTPDQFSFRNASFDEVLEELSSRFILNLPEDELLEVERVCFQVEQAHWYYEDFIREENPLLPSYTLKKFSEILFRACPLLHHWSHDHETAFNDFMEYKTRVPVCGAIMLNDLLTKCVLVKGWKASAGWSFPRGKVNENEDETLCAAREVLEETGYNLQGQIQRQYCIKLNVKRQPVTLFVVPGVPEDFQFITQTRKEISKIDWFKLSELPGWKKATPVSTHKFYLIQPVVPQLKTIVRALRKARKVKRAQSEVSENAGVSVGLTEERSFGHSNLSSESLLITEPSFQSGSGEAELSSSQSSSVDPHTPSVHGDLSPFADKLSVKEVFTIDAESIPAHTANGLSLGQVTAPSGDMQSHWSRLMSRLANSDSPSLGTPQAVTPTPAVSEREFPANGASFTTSSSADSSCSTVHIPCRSGPVSIPQPTISPPRDAGADLIKRNRQLQLLDSVLAEETARQATATPPRSAHLLGRFPSTNTVPAEYLYRAASVNPVAQHEPTAAIPVVPVPSHVSRLLGGGAPSFYSGMNNGPYGPVPRPSTALSSQPELDLGHRAQMLAILSGPGHRIVGADYLGHRGFSSTSSLSGGNRQRGGGSNVRLLSILNGEGGR